MLQRQPLQMLLHRLLQCPKLPWSPAASSSWMNSLFWSKMIKASVIQLIGVMISPIQTEQTYYRICPINLTGVSSSEIQFTNAQTEPLRRQLGCIEQNELNCLTKVNHRVARFKKTAFLTHWTDVWLVMKLFFSSEHYLLHSDGPVLMFPLLASFNIFSNHSNSNEKMIRITSLVDF